MMIDRSGQRADLAPWVAETLVRLARITAELSGQMTESEVDAAFKSELSRAPRPVTYEEITRGCAIATELMTIEAEEEAHAPA
ncbi:MAG: hypothetical protein EA355_13495 [Rhodobacteraceae bacterium]|nr:MAG: hypothetical protein EA355_13495 [Paracoccaceae bacterium]